ncbi:MAG: hypothetical protein WC343_09410, partial [Bacilli bacterium]
LKQESGLTLSSLGAYKSDLVCVLPFISISLHDEIKALFKHLYLSYSTLEERDLIKPKSNKLIFVNEVLYINKEDQAYLKYLYLIRDAKKIAEIDTYQLGDNHHLLSYEEVSSFSNEDDLK